MKKLFTLLLWALGTLLSAQIYFPPTSGTQWDKATANSLGWCTTERDTLLKYLESRNSKSFLILHRGRIVEEEYMNGFGQDSIWYWASAGKSLMAFLLGMAQEDGLLDIHDQTSQYLDTGWTALPRAKEDMITLWHQITMTTGLNFNVPNQDCLADTCLTYLHDAGTHWYYHNAPYRLTQDVLEVASGQSLNLYTLQSLTNTTGIFGLWLNYIFFSRARDMARFGLLCLNEGKWNTTPVLGDTTYFRNMIRPSQNLNQAYGYLWWLNGSSNYKQPGLDLVFPGEIIPTAPSDLYMAAGKNDQRIYVVPSLDLVVVRQGDAAYTSLPALSAFDKELWELVMNYLCPDIGIREVEVLTLELYPNPASDYLYCSNCGRSDFMILSANGTRQRLLVDEGGRIFIGHLPSGIYLLWDSETQAAARFVKN